MNLIAAAIIGIAVIVLLIAACKVHPFLSLLAGSFVMAVCAGVPFDKAFDSFTSGVGGTISNVGLLIAFGSIIGTILFKSGGADTIVDTIMAKTPLQRLPWAMALIAFIVGIPMFFEVGVVILIPVVLFAARRSKSLWCCSASRPSPPVHAARLRAAAPRSADRHRRAEREPRHHPGPRPDRGHPDRPSSPARCSAGSPPSGFRSQLRRTRLRPKLRSPRKTARPSAPPCP